MDTVTHRFRDLNMIVDRVHNLFEQWKDENVFSSPLDEDTLHMLRLAIHEWVANLVQHAEFRDQEPEISINLMPSGARVFCTIEDNSLGFDLDTSLRVREATLESFPERGMGLLMLEACTDHLSYTQTEEGKFRLKFSVSADQDPWLHIPF